MCCIGKSMLNFAAHIAYAAELCANLCFFIDSDKEKFKYFSQMSIIVDCPHKLEPPRSQCLSSAMTCVYTCQSMQICINRQVYMPIQTNMHKSAGIHANPNKYAWIGIYTCQFM